MHINPKYEQDHDDRNQLGENKLFENYSKINVSSIRCNQKSMSQFVYFISKDYSRFAKKINFIERNFKKIYVLLLFLLITLQGILSIPTHTFVTCVQINHFFNY
jgi:hypothetical protein